MSHGQNQATVAIGDGAYAGLAIHEDIRPFPKSLDEPETAETDADGDAAPDLERSVPGGPPDLRAQMRRVRNLQTHPGLREPSPGGAGTERPSHSSASS